MARRRPLRVLVALLLLWPLAAVAQPEPLDHDAYDRWKAIDKYAISDDGQWVLLSVSPPKGDGELRVQHTASERAYTVPRGVQARFTDDSRFVVFAIAPPEDSVRQAKLDERPEDEHPKKALGILTLDTGEVTEVERVQSYRLPDEGGWIAYQHAPAPEDTTAADSTAAEGAPLVVRHLASGATRSYEHATDYTLSENGRLLAYVAAPADSTQHGVYAADLPAEGDAPAATPLLTGAGDYPQLAVDEAGTQVAFLTDRDAPEDETDAHTLYHWRRGQDLARAVARSEDDTWPDDWIVSEHGALEFSKEGRRLFFGTAPRPLPEAEADSLLPEERVTVDIWNWKDPYLQPMQKLRIDERRTQTYRAVYFVEADRTLQLATEAVPQVIVGREGEADVALGVTNRPYRHLISWDWPPYYDAYLIDLATGERRRILEKEQTRPTLSPAARYVYWWDRDALHWMAMATDGGAPVNLTADLPHPVFNERHDVPSPAGPYGTAGWTEDDERLLVYDRHDVWAVDPTGTAAPRAVTESIGRDEGLRFRVVDLDPDAEALDPEAPLLLSAFHVETKAGGFYRDRVDGTRPPAELVMMDRRFFGARRAEDADRLVFRRSSFEEFPDLWVSALDLSDARKITDVNPQQAEYRWGTAELVEWTSLDGIPLKGILYTPEDFDPSEKYPMMVYFYERNADYLHRYWRVEAHRSIINFPFYVSRGYVVFVPDIVYKEGYPGESAMNAVMPGVTKLIDRGFVDEERIGVQGHSWGGYQIAYMVTRTNLFAAAEAGAPVSNMVSAYGGIRWGSGMSRMFQYEQTQSRIGGSLWEKPMRYLENSPIFWADKIETPLMMMHNDHDGAVPWYQGIELFVALRRLGKPAWLVNYNDEPHWPTTLAHKRDWARRMQQFFDHYLKDAPAPQWLDEGVPAVEKGHTLGLEPATPATAQ